MAHPQIRVVLARVRQEPCFCPHRNLCELAQCWESLSVPLLWSEVLGPSHWRLAFWPMLGEVSASHHCRASIFGLTDGGWRLSTPEQSMSGSPTHAESPSVAARPDGCFSGQHAFVHSASGGRPWCVALAPPEPAHALSAVG